MEQISVFDIIKIGVGPSSSHTMGPWRAALKCLTSLRSSKQLDKIIAVRVDLYGSLAKTGRGHGTGVAIIMGLLGEDPITVDTGTIFPKIEAIKHAGVLLLGGNRKIPFVRTENIVFNMQESLPFHPNGMRFSFIAGDDTTIEFVYYSIGGGFVIEEGQEIKSPAKSVPYPIEKGIDLLNHCLSEQKSISQIVFENEKTWCSEDEIHAALDRLWITMRDCLYRGCHAEGILPGGLNVKRRAAGLNNSLLGSPGPDNPADWFSAVMATQPEFRKILKWVSCFALATNEENAAFGRVVTAPTNGAAGVIPAVIAYMACFCPNGSEEDIRKFLLVAGELGSLFKKGATISAAMGGCQAEIGVSSAMAAGALTECLGGTPAQVLMAAEIAMEHHLGLTCDPIGGLVQIPCIERNAMGAMKAITAADIALESDPATAKVSLDSVIESMWETARDMSSKYKETAEGGLAVNIPINVIEC